MIPQPRNPVNQAMFVFAVCALLYIGFVLADVEDLAARKKILAYCSLFATAVYATSLPNALIPDRFRRIHQLLNTTPEQLFAAKLRRWLPVVCVLCLPPMVIAFYDPVQGAADLAAKGLHLVNNLVIILTMGYYSLAHYFSVGPAAQAWREGTAGKKLDRFFEFAPPLKPPIPRGLMPALTATSHVFIAGTLPVVAALKVDQVFGAGYILLPSLLFLLLAVYKIRRVQRTFDRYYYQTNAFYDEVFSRGAVHLGERDPIAYDAVYWVPKPWKAHAWAGLVQLDRLFPIGRFLAVALALYVIVSIQNPPGSLVNTIVLSVIICTKNMTVYLLTLPRLAPDFIEATFQSKANWSVTRFFINIRWTLPLGVFLCGVAWLSRSFTYQVAAGWIVLDVGLAFLFAWSITFATFKYQRTQLAA